jgi:hypothetical protein
LLTLFERAWLGGSAQPEALNVFHDWIASGNSLKWLDDEDGRVAAAVKAAGCPDCGGRLCRADDPRMPSGPDNLVQAQSANNSVSEAAESTRIDQASTCSKEAVAMRCSTWRSTSGPKRCRSKRSSNSWIR